MGPQQHPQCLDLGEVPKCGSLWLMQWWTCKKFKPHQHYTKVSYIKGIIQESGGRAKVGANIKRSTETTKEINLKIIITWFMQQGKPTWENLWVGITIFIQRMGMPSDVEGRLCTTCRHQCNPSFFWQWRQVLML